jgi:hypothetical protein
MRLPHQGAWASRPQVFHTTSTPNPISKPINSHRHAIRLKHMAVATQETSFHSSARHIRFCHPTQRSRNQQTISIHGCFFIMRKLPCIPILIFCHFLRLKNRHPLIIIDVTASHHDHSLAKGLTGNGAVIHFAQAGQRSKAMEWMMSRAGLCCRVWPVCPG